MKAYRIIPNQELVPINTNKNYKIKSWEGLKQKLSQTKSLLDNKFTNPMFAKYWKEFDPFKHEKPIISEICNTCNVSNAWLKCYEILNYFQLIPKELADSKVLTDSNEFLHFDNAAFPGSFILATHHYIQTQCKWKEHYIWQASSLFEATQHNQDPLEDKYKLYQNYPDNWLMDSKNNGDVTVKSNLLDFRKKLNANVSLYTSDLAFDVSTDYNNQELLQSQANIGQILAGLLTIKQGGNFLTKQFTTFEPITITCMYAVASFFDEFYLCKPQSSRSANSETYLVGKGFKLSNLTDITQHPYIQAMFTKLTNYATHGTTANLTIPLFDASHLPSTYLKTILDANNDLYNTQINKILNDIERTEKCLRNAHRGPSTLNPEVMLYNKSIEADIVNWYKQNPCLPINKNDKLRIKCLF